MKVIRFNQCVIINLIVAILLLITMLAGMGKAAATIHGVYGFEYEPNEVVCGGFDSGVGADGKFKFKANYCNLTVNGNIYVPHSGQYKVFAYMSAGEGQYTTSAYFDENIPLSEQDVTVSGSDRLVTVSPTMQYTFCYELVDEAGKHYSASGTDWCHGGSDPLPPTPPQPPTSCTLNNGNPLNVSLGTLERSQLPTVPGTGSMTAKPVDVECTGGIDVTVSMKLNYTPITISGTETVKSSSNGLGVAIIYNGAALKTTDDTPVTFVTGSNSLDLSFQAVRDPTVEVGDIPTGAFTASAVLVMTQQ